MPVFPENFDSLEHARAFLTRFVAYYNQHHRHSGIGLHTPGSVHDGTWRAIHAQRQTTLDAAAAAHPERFRRGRPQPPLPPKEAWINRPTITTEIHTRKSA